MEQLEKEFREKYHLSVDKYESIQSRYAKAKEQATAGMGTVGKTIYYGVADITSGLALTLFTGANPWLMAVAMGLTTSDEVQMSKEQAGVDPKRAAGTAALCGAPDAALGRFVFGKIDIDRNIIKGVQKSIGEQLGSAFVHGSASAIISNLCYQTIDVLMNGNLSDIGICYTAYLDEGLSEEEAWNRTEKDFAEQEFRNAMAGGFLATGYAAIHLHSNGEKTVKTPKMDDYDEPLGLQKTARSAGDESGSKTEVIMPSKPHTNGTGI